MLAGLTTDYNGKRLLVVNRPEDCTQLPFGYDGFHCLFRYGDEVADRIADPYDTSQFKVRTDRISGFYLIKE